MVNDPTITSVYFRSMYLRDIRCFTGDFYLEFFNKQEGPARWTVLLGNNNTGKTTAIKILAGMSYPGVLSEFINKYRHLNKLKLYKANSKIISESGFFFEWLTSKKTRPIVGPNLFLPFFDFSLQIKRTRYKSVDLNNLSQIEAKYINDYDYNSIKIYQENLIIYAYGIHRKISEVSLSESISHHPADNLFKNSDLLNVEEWFLQTDYATKIGSEENRIKAQNQLDRIKRLLLHSKIFPDVKNLRVSSTEDLQSYIELDVGNTWIRLKELGYGYQATIAWIFDLTKRMLDRYPNLENPLQGPAIVLVDEIDLHLHPEWQRKIIQYLSDLFPNTQFIVTAHSPLIVQSAENINLIMLEKDEKTGGISVRQQFGSFQGWTVEEILRELMDMGEKTRSDRFLKLLSDFENALDKENYDMAKTAYDELDKILHPASSQRKLLSMQLSSLVSV